MSDDSNDPQRDDINCVKWRNENTILRARHQAKTQNSSIMNAEDNIRNNVLSSYQSGSHRILHHTGSNYYKQRTKYNLRETSPMSLRSVPTNLQSNYSRSQWCEMDARCQSPFSIRTTSDAPSNMRIRSAIDVVSAIKSLKFNRRESKMMRDAFMDYLKGKCGGIRKARRQNKKFLKRVRRQSGGDSGEQGSNSSISRDDYSSSNSSDDYNSSISSDDYNSSICSDDYNASISSDDYNSSNSSDDYNSSNSSDDYNSPISSDDNNSSICSDDYNASISSDDYNSSNSSDDYKSSISSDDYNSSISSDDYNASISSDDYNSVRSARNMTSRFRYQNSDRCARSMPNFPVNYRQPQIHRTLLSEALRNNTVCADNTRKQHNLNKYISSNSHNCYNSALQYQSNKFSMPQRNRYQSIATIPEEIYQREPPKFSHVATYKDVNNFDMDNQNSSISSDDCSSLRSAGTMTGRVSHQNSVNAKSSHNFPRNNVKNCNTLNSTSKYNVPSHIKYPQKELPIALHNFNPRFSTKSYKEVQENHENGNCETNQRRHLTTNFNQHLKENGLSGKKTSNCKLKVNNNPPEIKTKRNYKRKSCDESESVLNNACEDNFQPNKKMRCINKSQTKSALQVNIIYK